ncbi:TIGR04282 family arsenosugar biosynthesis glycosyltransferase [Simiduia sp. 21SJ11W-1]|uniref:TIGR04282 family arsenosugar biosynthesis glycosyltransferase n=1 Tax=Simiduia sp. 21SJ11W-1 TaxID=2909669 RepID=UPI0020A0F48C|nr:TIGR04282 family arsenosugar biosynthesis glycosyltransferase [Simiduia sp. 21SJ11W-1]UTA49434.1 TIGR04282 family arsenosugar biosynthesis glycosyltransferase [Simiduia sp. 21SJ11W-1]
MPRGIIIQFAKLPRAGHVKTRMQPVLTTAQSCALHQALLAHSFETVQRWSAAKPGWGHCLAVTDPEDAHWGRFQAPLWAQPEGDLGARMAAAVRWGKDQGAGCVLIIGSDCPGLGSDYLNKAAEALEGGAPLVVGPAADGGYVLIGMREPQAVFGDVHWGSDKVLAQTLARAKHLNLHVHHLPTLDDIDRPEDLVLLENWSALAPWSQFER